MRAGGFALFPLDGDGGIAQSAQELARGEHPRSAFALASSLGGHRANGGVSRPGSSWWGGWGLMGGLASLADVAGLPEGPQGSGAALEGVAMRAHRPHHGRL